MKFGPLDSPTKTIDLLNLVDHLRVVLAAIPFVSQAGRRPASSWESRMNRVRPGRIFFPDPVSEKIIPLGNLFSPNFGILKVQGGCPMEKYSATKEKCGVSRSGVCWRLAKG